MKTLFIEAKSSKKISLPKELIASLPKHVALFTTVQFIDNSKSIIKQLKKANIDVEIIRPDHCVYDCQLLGCSIKRFEKDVDAFLYVGDGEFHPKALMLKNEKPVFVYNPFSDKHFKLDKEEVEILKKKQKGAMLKFLTSKEIGILITTKPGQYNMKAAENLKKNHADKNFYLIVADTIDFNSLQDFPFIECFVNTACPRIGYDDSIKLPKPVINVEEII